MDRLVVNDKTVKAGSVKVNLRKIEAGDAGYKASNTEKVEFSTNCSRWVIENMPAFKPEAYMTSMENFLTAMTFELSWVQYPQSAIEHYTLDWTAINRRLLEVSYFGGHLKKRRLVKAKVAQISEKYSQPEEKMLAIHDFVKNEMKWNKQSRYSSLSIKKAYEKGKGNSADINLLLILMLQEAGLDVKPVCLSTRSNGFINPSHPTETQLNYVIANVTIGEKEFLLDATDPLLPISLLPKRCFNGKGRLIQEGEGGWVTIEPEAAEKEVMQVDVKIEEGGKLTGILKTVRKDYSAYNFRKTKLAKGDDEAYVKYLEESYEGLEVEEYSCKNEKDLSKDIREEYSITINDQINANGDFIYLNPLLLWTETESPFKMEDRKYPINFGIPINRMTAIKYTIPEGYAVEELPEVAIVTLPEKAAKYTFHITTTGNIIQITNKFQVNRTVYTYEALSSAQRVL